MPANKANSRAREGKACDAVIRVLEARTGLSRANIEHPELDGRGSPVELVFDLGTLAYAVEHTLLEAFPEQVRMDVDFAEFIQPIQTELCSVMPFPGVYRLILPTDPCSSVRKKDWGAIQQSLIAWVRKNANELWLEDPIRHSRNQKPQGYRGQRRAMPTGVPFEVTLNREVHWSIHERLDGTFITMRYAPNDVEKLRLKLLSTALDRKCPKLQNWKDRGHLSILIFENNDIALSNHAVIQAAIEELLGHRGDAPDEIYLVDTTISDEWTVWALKRGNLWWPDEDTPHRYHEFKVHKLKEITGTTA